MPSSLYCAYSNIKWSNIKGTGEMNEAIVMRLDKIIWQYAYTVYNGSICAFAQTLEALCVIQLIRG